MSDKTEQKAKGVVLVHDLLSPHECQEWIVRAEGIGFDEAPVTTAAGPKMRRDVRNNDRVMIDDADAVAGLWERLEPHLTEHWRTPSIECRATTGEFEVAGLNERLRFYRYAPGQRFAIHRDGYYRRSEDELSLLTLLVYLDEACEGGETTVVTGAGAVGTISVAPRAGLALLFQHDLLHEGSTVTSGVKHVLRTDVMYRRIGR